MLLSPPFGTERTQALAEKLGCVIGELEIPDGRARPALLGSPSAFATTLQEFGGKWDESDKVYLFTSWPVLEAALLRIEELREKARLR